MRVGIVSGFGCSLAWALRLQDEGHDVAVWQAPKVTKDVGKGLVELVGSYDTLKQWVTLGHKGGIPSMMFFDASSLGDKAEVVRESGVPVLGGGKFADRLEKDRIFGFKIAEECGMRLPPHKLFDSIDAARRHCKSIGDRAIYFKSNRYMGADATHSSQNGEMMVEYLDYLIREHGSFGSCIVQDKVEGVPISHAQWWNGSSFVGPIEGTIEHKAFMNDDVGPSTGCALNAVWFYQGESLMDEVYKKLGPLFRQYKASPGLYDINAVLGKDGHMYFLEWTPRLGYDSEMTSFRLFPNLGELLWNTANGLTFPTPSKDLAFALRVTIAPYPWEHSKQTDQRSCLDTYLAGDLKDLWSGSFIGYQLKKEKGGIEVASPEGIVGLTYSQGKVLSTAVERAEKAAKALRIPGLQYRTDAFQIISKDAKKARSYGASLPEGLVH